MPDFSVVNFGTDTSGRSILMTKYMRDAHKAVLADPTVAPFAELVTIVQGAFMARVGGGADASAGYHDQGGCIDYRTWNLSGPQLEAFIRAWRRRGGAAWRRDSLPQHGGMDAHCHVTLGSDEPLTSGAQDSWNQYVNGDNGLTGDSHGPDYEWRPSPLVLRFTPQEDDDMQDADFDRIAKMLDFRFDKVLNRLDAARERDARVREQLGQIKDGLAALEITTDETARKQQVKRLRERLDTLLKDPETPQL